MAARAMFSAVAAAATAGERRVGSNICSNARHAARFAHFSSSLSAGARNGNNDLGEDSYEHPDQAPIGRRPQAMEVASSIAEGVKEDTARRENRHTLAVLVDNEAGVLSKISGLLSARGFNIESLTVSPTNIPDLSRMTIVIKDVPEAKAQQAYKQLSDIVNVWAVVDYTGSNSLHRELVMVKVSYMPPSGHFRSDAATNARPGYKELLGAQNHRSAVRDLGQLFGAEVVDVGSRHIVFQLTSWSRRIDAFIRMLEPWGIIEVARSGVVAMLRSPVAGSMSDQIRTPTAAGSAPDVSQLPPG